MEQMLCLAYSGEGVPQDVKIRLKNRMACHKAMETKGLSFWWLPATAATVISLAVAVIVCMLYVVINIYGMHSWMPNLLQLVSEMWLKIHLFALVVEVVLSWLFTIVLAWTLGLCVALIWNRRRKDA